ncbi:hypothetical protein BGW80DRAFT_226303 [Lactifluus volemus]|nr:hypothetical protein BGW80DRAFT_226303 [Lactifluus volemus]
MSSETWSAIGNIASVSGITGNVAGVIMGAVAGYRAVGSAHTSLQDTRQKLQEIRENLEAVPAKRQRQIEAAALRGRCKSFVHVKEKLQDLWDTHIDMKKQYAESSFSNRFIPGSGLRKAISDLHDEVEDLLKDTWTTTQAHIIAREFTPLPDEVISSPVHREPAGSGPRSPV